MTAPTSATTIEIAFAHHQAGRLPEAEAYYREILRREPANPDALHLLGTLAFQEKRNDDALALIANAIAIEPQAAEFHASLGQALAAAGRTPEAIDAYRQSLALGGGGAEVHYNLGCALLQSGLLDDAANQFRTTLTLRPDFPQAHINLSNILRKQGDLDGAIECCRAALAINPALPTAYFNLGQLQMKVGELTEAITSFDRALELDPDFADARSGKIYALHFQPGIDAQTLLRENLLWNERHAKPLARHRLPHDNDRSPDRRLRIGYVSPDFRWHVAGFYLLPLLREHDHSRFEIFCYCNVRHCDAMTDRFRSYADVWRDISKLDDATAAAIIREDRIDILIDTTMHMGGNRLGLFARKPAPVQVTFCAYPSTTGLETMDYRLTDSYLDPPGTDSLYSEQSIRLPDSFWCYDPTQEAPEVGPLPAGDGEKSILDLPPPVPSPGTPGEGAGESRAIDAVTFGCLNNFCKANSRVLALWAAIMRAVPRSRLLLLTPRGRAQTRVLAELAAMDIDSSRVSFVEHQPRPEYLATYNRIDIGLDTFPYNGHTTSLDAFWMGVPVVALVGHTAVGWAGLSQLTNLGLAEFVASSEKEFIAIAVRLASDKQALAGMRKNLRVRMAKCPLTDVERFARNVEDAFRRIWRRRCE